MYICSSSTRHSQSLYIYIYIYITKSLYINIHIYIHVCSSNNRDFANSSRRAAARQHALLRSPVFTLRTLHVFEWKTPKVGSWMEVKWRTVTWFCSSPSHSEGVENKSLSRRRCVVVDYLNEFEIYLPNGSRGPLDNIVVVRNMKFVSPKVWNMWFSVLNVNYDV